jgi:hypothetical protein
MKVKFILLSLLLSLSAWAQTPLTVVQSSSNCPCTIFGSATPKKTTSGPDSSVELGSKFTVDVTGSVTALRFYKMTGETGTHTGSLWDSKGNLLAQVTYTNETTSGWQTQALTTPVQVTTGNTYVVTYHTSNGFEALDAGFFAAQFDAAPLHVPATGGVYAYGSTPRFPTTSTQTNYYADVVFNVHYATLSWGANSNNPNNVTYNVFRTQTQGSYNYNAPLASGLTGLTYNDTTVVSGQTYWYEVTAVIQSAPSNEAQAIIP